MSLPPHPNPDLSPIHFSYGGQPHTWDPSALRLHGPPTGARATAILEAGLIRAHRLHYGVHIPALEIVRRWAAGLDGSIRDIRLVHPSQPYPAIPPGSEG